jgi:hypothetical protein
VRFASWPVVVLAATAIAVPAAVGRARTTSPNVFIDVHITLTGSKVIVEPKSGPRGSDARLIVHNISKKPQVFAFNYKNLGNGAYSGLIRTFKPGEKTILLLYLSMRGVLPYYSGPSYKKASPAARGKFLVGDQCALCNPD